MLREELCSRASSVLFSLFFDTTNNLTDFHRLVFGEAVKMFQALEPFKIEFVSGADLVLVQVGTPLGVFIEMQSCSPSRSQAVTSSLELIRNSAWGRWELSVRCAVCGVWCAC